MKTKLEKLKQIAKEAGAIIKSGYLAKKEITHKGVVDLVTEFDLKCEAFIIEELKEHFSDYTLIGEESWSGGEKSEKAIYIDPIDGTTNFIHGIPHLGISIGVYENGLGLFGIVYNPILDEMFYAQKDGGAYLNGELLQVSSQNSLQQSLIATGFPYAKVNKGIEYEWVMHNLGTLLPDIRDIRRLGAAALDLCYLAQGKVDGFYEIDLKPWDVAAGMIILSEAGGVYSNANGEDYTFDSKTIVASNKRIHKELLAKLSVGDVFS
ncbi:MAG: inositol monophosphatase [Campylobacterales bacterium]|nr:inositol monophosphatase [Campylobacterales bacterium]